MKKINTLNITTVRKGLVALVLIIIIQGTALAQGEFGQDDSGPGDFGVGDNPLDEPASPSPIDNYVGALVLFGIAFAFYKSRSISPKIN